MFRLKKSGPFVLLLAYLWLGMLVPVAPAFDFSWFATADTLDWFGIDNPVVGNTGWTLVPGGITTQAPDDPGDRAFMNASAKTTSLSSMVTVGTVQVGSGAVGTVLRLQSSTAILTAVDEFLVGSGGELQLLRGAINVTGADLNNLGLIHAVSNATVIGAGVQNSAAGEIRVDSGATLTFTGTGTTLSNQGTITTIAGGTLNINDGVHLTMNGGSIDNQGDLTLGNGVFNFNAGSTTGNPLLLTNTELHLDPAVGPAAFSFRGGILNGNIAANQIVIQRNNGLPLVAPDSFTNAGELRLEGLNSSQSIVTVMGGGIITNIGTVRAVAESMNGLNRHVNGTIDNQANLTLDPSVNLIVEGLDNSGTTDIGAGASLQVTNTGSNSGSMNFGAGSQMTVDPNGSFTHAGGSTTLDGTWMFGAGSTLDYTGGLITGNGHIQLDNATLNLAPGGGPMTFEFNNGSLSGNIDAGQTVRQQATLGELSTPDSFTNAGLLELTGTAFQEVRLNIQGGGMLTNTGTLHAKAGLPSSFSRRIVGTVDNQATLNVDPGVNFTVNGLINSGDLNMGAGATLNVNGGVFSQNGGTITNTGITINNSTVNFNGGDIVGVPIVIAGNSSLHFGPNVNGTASFIHAGGNISGTIGPNTTVTLQANTIGTRTIVANGSLTNEGNLQFDQSPGGAVALQVDGLQLVNEIGGTVSGNGTVVLTAPGAKYVNRGVHATGNSSGQFDVDGDFENTSSGTLEIEIGGTNPIDFDVMIVTGNASLAGSLDLSLIGGFSPGIGDEFTILSAAAGVTGQFDQVTGLASLFDVAYNANSVVLTAKATSLLSDLDLDGDVDGSDFLFIQRTDPSRISQWQTEYGNGVPSLASLQTVPEPSAPWLLLAGISLYACLRRAEKHNGGTDRGEDLFHISQAGSLS